MTTLINCHINPNENRLTFGVLTRKPSQKLKILKSDPFTLYNTTGIKNSYQSYVGPDHMLLDTETKCLIPVPDFEKSQFIPYTKDSVECSKTPFESIDWTNDQCSVEHHFEVIQIKRGSEYNYLYCYEQNITIKSRTFECPNQPFRLSTNTSFKISDFSYNSKEYFNFSTEIYICSELTNRFLTYVRSPLYSSLDDHHREIGQIRIPEFESMKTHSYHTVLIVSTASIR